MCVDSEVGDARGSRRGVRPRRARRAARHLGAARHRRADGAARGGRRLRRGDAAATRSTPAPAAWCGHKSELAEILGVPETAVRVVAQRRRRQFRHAEQLLPGVRAGRLGGAAPRPAGEVDVRAPRGVSHRLPGPRPRRPACRAGARRRGQLPRAARLNTSNIGAHAVSFVPLNKGVAICRPASTACRPSHSAARAVLTQHVADRAYRSAGRPEVMFVMERLIDLAARRHGFDRIELRRRNLVPPERDAVPQPVRHDLRQRRLRGGAGPRGGARATGPGSRRAAPRRARRGRYRGIGVANYIEIDHRRAARARGDHGAPGRRGRRRDRHAVVRARATRRASPSSSSNGSAWRSTRCGSSPATPTSCAVGGGSHSGALDAARRRRDGEGLRPDHRQGQAHRRVAARGGAEADIEFAERPLRGEGHRPLGRPVRGRGRRAAQRRAGGIARAARGGIATRP